MAATAATAVGDIEVQNASTLVWWQSSGAPAGRALARLVGCQLSRKAPVKQLAGAQLSVFSFCFLSFDSKPTPLPFFRCVLLFQTRKVFI